MKEISRRTFIQSTIAVAATLVSANPAEAASTFKLGKVTKFKPGSLLIVTIPGRSQKVSVLATAKGYFAFSTSCTHQGFQLRADGNKLVCDNHGAQFNSKTGAVTSGPATRALTKYKTSVKKGYLYITL
jgi:nitrite reductase/ring-hydroxylating ferredoxin subunit